jgi:prevent-host-death family protein
MTVVTIHKAKTELSKLLARVEAGEEIVIARGDEPIAKLVPIDPQRQTVRGYGRFAHLRDKIPPDMFLQPLPQDELDAWEGKYSFPSDNGE